jgi:lipopolysaccharide transport system ATP-binding protein
MSLSKVELSNVHLDYKIYSLKAQSLRNAVLNVAVGGRLLKSNQDMVSVRALNNISFKLTDGDRLGLMGHNGSGKTSLLKVLAGIYHPSNGTIDIEGRVSSMIEIGHGVEMESNAVDNIRILSAMRLIPSSRMKALIPEILDFADLGAYAYLPLKTYSSGMLMRLLFAVATSFEPDVLLLDEWLGAGDAGFVDRATKRMSNLVDSAKIVVLASHSEGLIRSVCNKLCVLEHGNIVYYGELDRYFEQQATAAAG